MIIRVPALPTAPLDGDVSCFTSPLSVRAAIPDDDGVGIIGEPSPEALEQFDGPGLDDNDPPPALTHDEASRSVCHATNRSYPQLSVKKQRLGVGPH